MTAYVVKRLASLVPVWLLVSVVAFGVMHLAPGDPAAIMLGPDATIEGLAHLRQSLGLDLPLPLQFMRWLTNVLRGDFGNSIFLGTSVGNAIISRLPVTLWLTSFSMTIALIGGLLGGIFSAINRRGISGPLVMTFSLLGLSTPEFLVGLGLIYVFSVHLNWLPIGGFISPLENFNLALSRLIMPGVALGIGRMALIARMTRSSMLDVLGLDYIRVARAKGVGKKGVIFRHALRNAFIPVVTVVGASLSASLAGAFVTESVFSLPGIGNLIIMAVKRRDYPVIQGGMLLIATLAMLINLVVDIVYAYIDPRIEYV